LLIVGFLLIRGLALLLGGGLPDLGGLELLFLLRSPRLGRLELRRDQRIVLCPQVDLVVVVARDRSDPLDWLILVEAMLALEALDLLDRDFELVRDPGVGSALPHPAANPVQFRP